MKDNFDIRKYLIENKLTEATRTTRQHFGDITLNEHVVLNEEENISDPESIVDKRYDKVVAKGLGFDASEIEQALKQAIEECDKGGLDYTKLYIRNTPSENSTHLVKFNDEGSYIEGYDRPWERECYTPDQVVEEFEQLLKDRCKPEELKQHTIGWIMTVSDSSITVYPYLDEEGLKIYDEAAEGLANSIHRSYKGSNYWGD